MQKFAKQKKIRAKKKFQIRSNFDEFSNKQKIMASNF